MASTATTSTNRTAKSNLAASKSTMSDPKVVSSNSGSSITPSSASSSSSTTISSRARLTPAPSTWQHFLYVLAIYRLVLLCLLFGCLSLIIGIALFLLAIIFRSNTTSIHLIESIPLYMPGSILVCNGLSLVVFMNKNTRRLYLLKSVFGLYLLITILMIIVTVTTSVIHLPRLHTHRECAYNIRIRACTCLATHNSISNNNFDQKPANQLSSFESSRYFIMRETMNCDLVHGLIFDSLRVVLALSLLAIAVSIFAMLTLYQLYIHERLKRNYNFNTPKTATIKNGINYDHTTDSKISQTTVSIQSPSTLLTTSINIEKPAIILMNSSDPKNDNLKKADKTNFKCLSTMDFTSQELLLDEKMLNVNANKNCLEANSKNLEYFNLKRSKIWSSQPDANFVDINEPFTHCDNKFSLKKNKSTSNLRKYIHDTSSNVQLFVGWMLNPFRRNDFAQSSLNKQKHHSLPPHVIIPRYSMTQILNNSNKLSPVKNNKNNDKKNFKFNSSNSLSSTSLSENNSSHSLSFMHTKSSLSTLTVNDKDKKIATVHYLTTANNEIVPQSASMLTNYTSDCLSELLNVEQSRTDFTSKYCQNTESERNEEKKNNENEIPWQPTFNLALFECIDEDDNEFYYQPVYGLNMTLTSKTEDAENPTINEQFEPNEQFHQASFANYLSPFESNVSENSEQPESCPMIMNNNEKVSSFLDFNFISNPNSDYQQYTTFEEAFKNYYDSQNRISNNYYTLPMKNLTTNKLNSSRYRKNHHSETNDNSNFKLNIIPSIISDNNDNNIVNNLQLSYLVNDNNFDNDKNNNPDYSGNLLSNNNTNEYDLSFPAIIEPPEDYQNVSHPYLEKKHEMTIITDNNNNNNNDEQTDCTNNIESIININCKQNSPLTNQLLQPYEYWLEQLQSQNDQPTITIKTNDDDEDIVQDDDDDYDQNTIENGFIEDDDNCEDGDTSTSQDIADFELEMDEEPVKFVSEEEFKSELVQTNSRNSAKNANIPLTYKNAFEDVKNTSNTVKLNKEFTAAKNNSKELEPKPVIQLKIKQKQLQLKNEEINSSDYEFDGFRRGCFDDESSSTSVSSSLTNDIISKKNHKVQNTENSITAEYIKPPNSFTNYRFKS